MSDEGQALSGGMGEEVTGTPSGVAVMAPEPVAATETPPVAAFDLSTVEGIKAAAAQFPSLQQWREEGFSAGKQTGRSEYEKQLRLDQGRAERVQEYHGYVVDQLNNGADPAQLAKQTPAWMAAHEIANRVALYTGLASQAASLLPADKAADIKARLELLEGQPEELEAVAQMALDALDTHAKSSALLDFDPDSIDATHPAYPKLQAWKEREVTSELNARAVQANAVPGTPIVPAGAAPVPRNLDALAAMPQTEQMDYLLGLATSNPAEYEKVKAELYAAG